MKSSPFRACQTEQAAVAWLRTPHGAPVFGGRAPIVLITSSTQDGLMSVRPFLDGANGGLYMPPNEIDLAFHRYQDADVVRHRSGTFSKSPCHQPLLPYQYVIHLCGIRRLAALVSTGGGRYP
ncbi:hypothetical protein KL86PLE_90192 [uncultured Pleomorphomonas sp.]|uniref:Antitoxin Xre/MbcA/ParS-like toxin-binding domain-containing protein n=1 Tax=uncultured Pleomorphomonas sp. TaxID=442121 RepID=A0A212LNB1_9HYPH|nr:hypothetical protein KL86PLE_90192 [uncultured Pleomorphomonas sp.]